jgi:hypothetical protein
VSVANSTHIPSLEVFLAFLADSQARVRELDIQRLFKTRWSKCQDILRKGKKDIEFFERDGFYFNESQSFHSPHVMLPVETSFAGDDGILVLKPLHGEGKRGS